MLYSLRKFAAAAWGAFTCVAILGTPANADTIYYYTGSPYTTISTENILDRTTIPATVVPNPNAAADAAVFGTNLTGSVTFGFDTTGVTGTFGVVSRRRFIAPHRTGPRDRAELVGHIKMGGVHERTISFDRASGSSVRRIGSRQHHHRFTFPCLRSHFPERNPRERAGGGRQT
jgi:hypothetical protein